MSCVKTCHGYNPKSHHFCLANCEYFLPILQVYLNQVEERPISRILETPDQNTLRRVFNQEKQMLPKTGDLYWFVLIAYCENSSTKPSESLCCEKNYVASCRKKLIHFSQHCELSCTVKHVFCDSSRSTLVSAPFHSVAKSWEEKLTRVTAPSPTTHQTSYNLYFFFNQLHKMASTGEEQQTTFQLVDEL